MPMVLASTVSLYAATGITEESAQTMSVKFLGINGFEFKSAGKTLLIDPYVSRDPARVTDPAIVRRHIKEADCICLGHSHWDHAADVAEIARYTGAIICGSETMLNICRYFKIPETRLRQFESRRPISCRPFTITPLKSKHKEPVGYPGYYRQAPEKINSVADYLEGGTWALLVRCGKFSFLNVGSANLIDEELRGIQCNYLLAGISGRSSDYLSRLLKCVRAKTIIPTHWDDFFGHPVEEPGERVSLEEFRKEIKSIDPKQHIKVLKVLEIMELQNP